MPDVRNMWHFSYCQSSYMLQFDDFPSIRCWPAYGFGNHGAQPEVLQSNHLFLQTNFSMWQISWLQMLDWLRTQLFCNFQILVSNQWSLVEIWWGCMGIILLQCRYMRLEALARRLGVYRIVLVLYVESNDFQYFAIFWNFDEPYIEYSDLVFVVLVWNSFPIYVLKVL